jgi:hypothetical protein
VKNRFFKLLKPSTLTLLLAIFLSFFLFETNTYAAPLTNTKCTKISSTTTKSGITYTCSKIGGKLIWVEKKSNINLVGAFSTIKSGQLFLNTMTTSGLIVPVKVGKSLSYLNGADVQDVFQNSAILTSTDSTGRIYVAKTDTGSIKIYDLTQYHPDRTDLYSFSNSYIFGKDENEVIFRSCFASLDGLECTVGSLNLISGEKRNHYNTYCTTVNSKICSVGTYIDSITYNHSINRIYVVARFHSDGINYTSSFSVFELNSDLTVAPMTVSQTKNPDGTTQMGSAHGATILDEAAHIYPNRKMQYEIQHFTFSRSSAFTTPTSFLVRYPNVSTSGIRTGGELCKVNMSKKTSFGGKDVAELTQCMPLPPSEITFDISGLSNSSALVRTYNDYLGIGQVYWFNFTDSTIKKVNYNWRDFTLAIK